MIRGLEDKHEHAAQKVARDTRPLGERVAEFLGQPATTFIISGTGIATSVIFREITDLIFIVCLCFFIFAYTRKHVLPYRLPKSSNAPDHNDPIPGSSKPKPAGGIAFFGNDRRNGEELWFTNDDMRTHVLIFGSTGSGKTEALVSIAFNSLVHGSDFIYVDGKGDNSLFAKVFSMTRGMGRDDDMLLINFMTGARDVIGAQENRLSNTMNPFSSGSSSMLAQLVVSLMDSGSGGGNGDMWKGRAMNFVESLMKILVAMRDEGHILLDANSIRDYFILEKLESMVVEKKFPISDERTVSIEHCPPQVLEPLKNYVLNLPGYNPKKVGDQAGEVREQHGFITMQLTRVFGSLADTYGHILRTNLAEVDLKDVVLNRRILVVLLPALEKSPEELSGLGKIIIASLKAMMAAGLGDAVEGDYRDVILRKPTNSPSPYVCIMDEYGYYAVQGFAVVPAQARSLGFSAIFAGQDLPAFQKASKEEAASIGANCNIKICMKLEDPQETWEFFNKVAGETYVTNVSGFQMSAGSMAMNYMDTKNASVDRRQRIELLDLKDQREGESHVFFKSKIIRATMFYANPQPVKKMRINHCLKIERPPDDELLNLEKRIKQFSQVFEKAQTQLPEVGMNEDITILKETMQSADDLKPFERGIAGLITILENEVERQQHISAPYENQEAIGKMSAFTRVPITPLIRSMIGDENMELFGLPLIRRGSTVEELKHIERLGGKTLEQAQEVANKLVDDIEKVTDYPPDIYFGSNPDALFEDINMLIKMFGGTPIDPNALPAPTEKPSFDFEDESIAETIPGAIDDFSAFLDDETSDLESMPSLSELPELPDLDELEKMLQSPEEITGLLDEEDDEDESEGESDADDFGIDEDSLLKDLEALNLELPDLGHVSDAELAAQNSETKPDDSLEFDLAQDLDALVEQASDSDEEDGDLSDSSDGLSGDEEPELPEDER